MRIERDNLMEVVLGGRGSTTVSIVYRTESKGVVKYSKIQALLGNDYEKSVKNSGDPEFKASPRRWGNVPEPYVVHHRGKSYLRYRQGKVYFEHYYKDGERFTPIFQEDSGPVRMRNLSFDNILAITYKGVTYVAKHKQQYEEDSDEVATVHV